MAISMEHWLLKQMVFLKQTELVSGFATENWLSMQLLRVLLKGFPQTWCSKMLQFLTK